MLERAAGVFPFVLSAALPLAGILIAAFQYQQGEREYGMRLALAAVLGVVIWSLLLTS